MNLDYRSLKFTVENRSVAFIVIFDSDNALSKTPIPD